jgi:hypothetical protein
MGDEGWSGHQTTNFHKAEVGLLAPTVTSAGTYTLAPAEPPYGAGRVQAIEIPRPDGSQLWLEFRQPYGTFDNFAPTDPVVNGVSIRVVSPDTRSHLIDMTPTLDHSTDDGALLPLHSFTDPLTGVTVKVNGVSAAGASVTISAPTTAAVANGVLTVSAGAGVDDNIAVTASNGRLIVNNSANRIAPGTGCTTLTANQVSCTGATSVTVDGADGNDVISVNAGAEPITLDGGSGNDTLTNSGTGPATELGRTGSDTLFGGAANDTLKPGAGADVVRTGGGIDKVKAKDAQTDTVYCSGSGGKIAADVGDVLNGCGAYARS